jgi:hypothetical protein
VLRRNLLFGLFTVAVGLASSTPAAAQGNGKGSSGGKGRGSSASGGKGKRGGNANGAASGNSTAGGNTSDNGAEGAVPGQHPQNSTGVPTRDASKSYHLRHRNGFEEVLKDGRYQMRDNRGRTIVNRAAGPEDYVRLRSLGAI